LMDDAIEAVADLRSYDVTKMDAIGVRGKGTFKASSRDAALRAKWAKEGASEDGIENSLAFMHEQEAAEVREYRWPCGFSYCSNHGEARAAHALAHPCCKPPKLRRNLDLKGVEEHFSDTVKGKTEEFGFDAVRGVVASGNEWYVQDAATRVLHLPAAMKERPGLDLSGYFLLMVGLGQGLKDAGKYFKRIVGAAAARLLGPSDDLIPFYVSKTRTYAVFATRAGIDLIKAEAKKMTFALYNSLNTPSGSLDNTMLCFLNDCGIAELLGVPLPDPRRCSQELSAAIYTLLAALRVFTQNAGVDKSGEFTAAVDGVLRLRKQAGAGASQDGGAGGDEMEQGGGFWEKMEARHQTAGGLGR